jgi:hypothetical protein
MGADRRAADDRAVLGLVGRDRLQAVLDDRAFAGLDIVLRLDVTGADIFREVLGDAELALDELAERGRGDRLAARIEQGAKRLCSPMISGMMVGSRDAVGQSHAAVAGVNVDVGVPGLRPRRA